MVRKVLPALLLGAVCIVALAACQQSKVKVTNSGSSGGKSASLRVMEQVAIAAHKCWFASKDPAFRSYRFANELSSYSGNPRFLLVPAKNYGGLPLLVVQARGGSSRVETFGPLLGEPVGARINGDIARWSSGDASCGSKA
jgi:hypothetical protein